MIDLNRLRELDVQELRVSVSRYADDMKTPAAYQATAKRRTALPGPWGVGVRATPEAAVEAALEEAAKLIRDDFRAAYPETAAVAPSKYGF